MDPLIWIKRVCVTKLLLWCCGGDHWIGIKSFLEESDNSLRSFIWTHFLTFFPHFCPLLSMISYIAIHYIAMITRIIWYHTHLCYDLITWFLIHKKIYLESVKSGDSLSLSSMLSLLLSFSRERERVNQRIWIELNHETKTWTSHTQKKHKLN